jgi:putative selenate reductase
MYLRRNGVAVTVFEKREKPMGIVEYVIPGFRISQQAIKADYDMAVKTGVEFVFGADENFDIEALKKSYDYIVIATGAWKEGVCPVKPGGDKPLDALDFLEKSKTCACEMDLGKSVAVIGGGDVAMDCARAAKRAAGSPKVSIVYRRTKDFMPAEVEEKNLALADGIEFLELLAPVTYENGVLTVEVMQLGERDADGRRKVVSTGETKTLEFDTVISAVGARVDTSAFEKHGIKQNSRGYADVSQSFETNIDGVYVAGDCRSGAATIVQAMADSKSIAKNILARLGIAHDFKRIERDVCEDDIRDAKAVLEDKCAGQNDAARCLGCDVVCEVCCSVCPNRANVGIRVNGKPQIVHVDGMCNECGNCGFFCPHTGLPYKDKFTLFWSEEDFKDSTNKGVLFVDNKTVLIRAEDGAAYTCGIDDERISDEYKAFMKAIKEDAGYMIP